MSYEHGIIQDLLPLYLDGVCSEESRRAVEEHLRECPACQKELDRLKEAATFSARAGETERERAASLKGLRRRLNWKRVLAVCLAVVVTLGAVTGAGMWLNSATITVPVETVKSVEYLPHDEAGLEAFNRATQELLEETGQDDHYAPVPMWAFSGGLHFITQGKYGKFGLAFYGMRRAGNKYVLLVSVRVTYWDALFHGGSREEHGNLLVPSNWEDWEGAVLAQYFGVRAVQPDVAEEVYDVMEDQIPLPEDEDCIFDEVYFFPKERNAFVFMGESNPDELEALLDSMAASGDAVLVWQRGEG